MSSRIEQQLDYMIEGGGELPTPKSRIEQQIDYIARHGGGGGGSWDDLSGKPFESIGTGLNVDDDGALNADGSAPTWGAVQDKPFTTIGEGLTVDEDGALNAEGGGTSDHRQLTNRDAANQHPISAITGLQDALDGKGTYSKPTTGIPKTDLASAVQESLDKADSALQDAPVASVNGKTGTVVLVPADLGIGSVFTLKGSKPTVSDLPASGNTYGDVWYVVAESVGYIWLNDGTEDRWEQLGLSIDLSAYRTAAAQDVIDNGKVSTGDYNPTAKTAEMTQAVGKDANGKLWTLPGEGGGLPPLSSTLTWGKETHGLIGTTGVTLPEVEDTTVVNEITYTFTATAAAYSFTAPDGYVLGDDDGFAGLSAGNTLAYANLTVGSVYETSFKVLDSTHIALVMKEWKTA